MEASATTAILHALPDPVLLLDTEKRVVAANKAAKELLGAQIEGRSLAMAIRHPDVLDAVNEVLEGGARSQVRISMLATVRRSFDIQIASLAATSESDADAILIMHDMTAERYAEQMRADFVANVSHELRTPLTSLVGFIETLRGPARGDLKAQDRFLDLMESQSTRMTRIVNDLLSLSRIEMNEHTVPRDAVLLKPTIATVADLLAPQARKRDVTIELDLDALTDPVIGHPDELTQLFQNLIENAIKYGGGGSKVRVEARVHGDMAAISVIDQGEGIAREHIPRLTERFYRVDTARSRELGGTGLGLAIVKHIANRHRGELTIRSEPGKGSTFTITLRLAPPSAR